MSYKDWLMVAWTVIQMVAMAAVVFGVAGMAFGFIFALTTQLFRLGLSMAF